MTYYYDYQIERFLRTKGIIGRSCASCGSDFEEGYGDYTEVELGKNRMALLTCSMASDLEEYIEKAKK